MLNQVIMVGRIAKELELKELENGRKELDILLSVSRSYKNANGEYDIDLIPCVAYGSIAENTKDYCKKGDLIGIKGSLRASEEDNRIYIIAEKLTFLSTKRG